MEQAGWLPLAALGIIWAAFLLPRRRPASLEASVEEFGRSMQLLAETDGAGRWIVAPAKGARFLGPRRRARVRARERRRKVFVFLLESIGLAFLIGLAPPLRATWYVAGILAGVLVVYVWLLLWLKQQEPEVRARERVAAAQPTRRTSAALARAQRYVAEGMGRIPRRTWGGLGSLVEEDQVHVVVRRVGAAGG